MSLRRTQIFLETEQREALERLARQQGRSISEIVHEYIDLGLARSRGVKERRLAVPGELADVGRRMGPIEGEPIAEMREERAQHLVEVLLQERDR